MGIFVEKCFLQYLSSLSILLSLSMNFSPEDLSEDLQNEQEFMDFFERKNIETLQLFAGNKKYNSLSDCFLIKHYEAMPRIGLTYFAKSFLPDDLVTQIVSKYKLLFGKWAKYEIDKKH